MRLLSILFVAALAVGSAYSDCTINDAQTASLDSSFGPTTGGNALTFNDNAKTIPGTSNNYDFNTKGIAQLHGGDNIILSGTMVPKNSTVDAGRYSLRAAFAKTTTPSDVKQELQTSAYASNGGPIDPSTWQFYQIIPESSQMVGIDPQNQGVTINMNPNPSTALQVGKGANGKNLEQGASGWFLFSASKDNTVVFESQAMEVVDINVNLGCSSTFACDSNVYSISKAVVDPALTDQKNSDQALFVDQVTNSFGQQVAFDLTGTSNTLSIDQTNGNLHLVGSFVAKQDSNVQVNCDLTFSTFIPKNGYMDKQELMPSAYVNNGGAIDPNLWAFYTVDTTTSSCQRVGGDKIVILGDHDNMGLQFGIGASGKNGNLGLSVWIDFQDSQVSGAFFDINVDVVCVENPNTALPETSPPIVTATPAPPATCPPGCVPYVPVVNVTVTETPAAGNGASNVEMSKLLVAIISLFALAFFH